MEAPPIFCHEMRERTRRQKKLKQRRRRRDPVMKDDE
jgi:hypothetical protein